RTHAVGAHPSSWGIDRSGSARLRHHPYPTMTPSFDFDLFVIGGGSGGVRAARMAAQRGARVGLAETLGTDGLGGTCVNVGCIPKKLYSYAAHYSEAFEESQGFGWETDSPPTFNWATLLANRAKEISRL